MFDYDRFRVNLIMYRKDFHLTQEMLAEQADIAVKNLGQIELGNQKPSTKTIIALMNALNTTVSAFMEYCTEDKTEVVKQIGAELCKLSQKEKSFVLGLVKIMNEG